MEFNECITKGKVTSRPPIHFTFHDTNSFCTYSMYIDSTSQVQVSDSPFYKQYLKLKTDTTNTHPLHFPDLI